MSATTSLADTYQSSNYQQGRLLLLSAGWRFWSPSRQTSVCPQRRRTTCLLSEAFWMYHAACARSPLVARPRADTVPPLCSDVPLSQRHSSVLPHWQYLPGSWRRGPPSPALVSHSNSELSRLSGDQPWATDDSRSPLHGHGTVCRQPHGLHRRSPPSDENWKYFFFTRVFQTTSHQFTVSSYVIRRYLIDCVECPCTVLRDSVT